MIVCSDCRAEAVCLCDGIISGEGESKRTCNKALCRCCTKRQGLLTDALYRSSTIDLCAECLAAGRKYTESEGGAIQ